MRENGLVVISGATKGIGRAIAEKFASQNYPIAVCARNENDLEEVKSLIVNKYKVKCFTKKIDMSVKSEVLEFGKAIEELNMPVSVLVNNAGVFMPGKIIDEPEGALETQIDTNLYSAYYLTRSLLPLILKSDNAHIFNVCSIASLMAYPNSSSYSISKFAMLGFSKSLREELKQFKVKVTSLMPGATYTSSWAGVDLPEDRFMKADDVADIIWASYNLSPQAVVEEIVLRPIEGDL
ncbi:SDR family oxidoreductase [Lacihabitans lacunae]|uniref:SDR family oxidoreductase n=1 Tax=Lacihabitans lacunae TaxID=1028214 RepID=A0ABV7Z1I6_9BACT